MVVYFDSSLGDEGVGAGTAQTRVQASPKVQTEKSLKVLPDSPSMRGPSDSPLMLRMDIGCSGMPGQSGDPFPQAMLKAMSSGQAFFGEDHWSRLKAGTPSK